MPPTPFSRQLRIRFSHSDPAGIVYYPNYFDMFNGLIEDWFSDSLKIDYARQIVVNRLALPTVHAQCDFYVPSRMGETLTLTLIVREVGRSSLKLAIHGHVGAQERLRALLVIVLISLDTSKSVAIPDSLRSLFTTYKTSHEGWTVAAAATI